MISKIEILNTHIDNITKEKLKYKLEHNLENKLKTVIFTPNTDMVLNADKDKCIQNILSSADLLIADGIGLVIASRILKTPLLERIPGIEIGEEILKIASNKDLSVFLLGGTEGVADTAAKKINRQFAMQGKHISICGTHHGYFDINGDENEKLILKINQCEADILFVCMGFPRQEKWIYDNHSKLKSTHLFIGLGGSLDIWSERLKRAPKIFQKLYLEWLWRIFIEPSRIKFIFKIPVFLSRILIQKYFIIKRQKNNGKNDY